MYEYVSGVWEVVWCDWNLLGTCPETTTIIKSIFLRGGLLHPPLACLTVFLEPLLHIGVLSFATNLTILVAIARMSSFHSAARGSKSCGYVKSHLVVGDTYCRSSPQRCLTCFYFDIFFFLFKILLYFRLKSTWMKGSNFRKVIHVCKRRGQ